MSIKIDDINYETYKKVYEIISGIAFRPLLDIIPIDSHPISVLNNYEAKSKSLAKKSLKVGLNDVLMNIMEMPENDLSEIRNRLNEHDLPTIESMITSIKKTIKYVLKKGEINSDQQFYIVREYLEIDHAEMSNEQIEKLWAIIGDYEIKKSN